MPRLDASTADPLGLDVDALIVPVFRGGIEAPGAEAALAALGLDEVPRDATFRGRLGETLSMAAPGIAAHRLVLVGLGRMDALSPETLRRAAGAATRALADSAASVATTLPEVHPESASLRAIAEGALLGAMRTVDLRSHLHPTRLTSVTLIVPTALEEHAPTMLTRATAHARGQALAATLVQTPADRLGPQDLCDRAREAMPDGIGLEIWDEERLQAERCGGVLAVGQGSARAPRMLLLRHRPEHPIASVAIVGKGITFDTGGLSLKRPNDIMVGMKADMGGAAAVIGTMSVLADLQVPVEVLGICAIAENMPSGAAQRPGDVLTTRGGTTVEVRNTDAEGRLVLADALSYAAEQGPDAIVDLATLTGAAKRALGAHATAAFGNDDDLLRRILRAAEDAGEPTWHMPLWEDLRPDLDSEVADVCHIGGKGEGGAIIAGLFLREFVDEAAWVHLDIAGPAYADEARWHLPKGGTGAGVRTLLRWLEPANG